MTNRLLLMAILCASGSAGLADDMMDVFLIDAAGARLQIAELSISKDGTY